EQEQDDADVGEQRAEYAVGDVQIAGHGGVHGRLHGGQREEGEDRVEEVARDEQKDGQDHPRDGRGEVETHLLLVDRPDFHGSVASSAGISSAVTALDSTPGGSSPTPSPPAPTPMKTSSPALPAPRSSRGSHCCWAASWKISPRTSRPRSDSTTKVATPSCGPASCTSRTPGRRRRPSSTTA